MVATERTAAAYDVFKGCAGITFLRASGYEIPSSVLTRWMAFSSFQRGQFLEYAGCDPWQFAHTGSLVHSSERWSGSATLHRAHVAFPRHDCWPGPNTWHLKQRSGFGMNGRTAQLKYPAWITAGNVGVLNVNTMLRDGTSLPSRRNIIRRTPMTP